MSGQLEINSSSEQTGNYYYGARYYNPTFSVWLSVDAKAHWYPSMSSYNFTANNPVMLVDPNGQWVEGEGFFTNLFYSDDRNEAMLIAGDKGDFKKMDNEMAIKLAQGLMVFFKTF